MAAVNIATEIFAMAVTALLLIFAIIDRRSQHNTKNTKDRVFIEMLVVNFLVLLADSLTWLLENRQEYNTLMYFLNFFVYNLGYVIVALFTYYMVLHISETEKISMLIPKVIGIFCVVAVLLVVISFFNDMYFSFEDGVYIRGPLYWVSQAYPSVILLIDLVIIFLHRKAIGWKAAYTLMSYGVLPLLAMIIQMFVFVGTLLYLATTLSMLIIFVNIHVEQGKLLKERELEITEMSVAIMLSQIQPHFLYNVLTSIGELCYIDPDSAGKAITKFSQFLRGNMDSLGSRSIIPFEQELKHTERYLDLEKMRFDERLKVEYHIEATDFRLPPLTLQPIAENAVRHGICKKPEGGILKIFSSENDDSYIVTVEDDGVGFIVDTDFVQNTRSSHNEKTHVGLKNVRERIDSQCRGTLTIESTPNVGTTAIISVPKEGNRL